MERAIDAGYPGVEEYLQDRRNSTDVTTLRCVIEYRAGADAWDTDYVEPKHALLGEHRAYVAELDALTAAGEENGGRLASVIVVVLGTKSYNMSGALRGSGGEYGARVDEWTGAALWETTGGTSTSGFAKALAKEGATIVDASTMIGYEQVEAPRGVEITGAFDAIDVVCPSGRCRGVETRPETRDSLVAFYAGAAGVVDEHARAQGRHRGRGAERLDGFAGRSK